MIINPLILLPWKWSLGLFPLNLTRIVTALTLEYIDSDPMWLPKLGHERTCSFCLASWAPELPRTVWWPQGFHDAGEATGRHSDWKSHQSPVSLPRSQTFWKRILSSNCSSSQLPESPLATRVLPVEFPDLKDIQTSHSIFPCPNFWFHES